MRALKFAVIAMGVLLVAGFVVLVLGFVQLLGPAANDGRPIVDVPLDRLDLEESSRIVSLTALDGRLILLVETAAGEQRLLTVDPDRLLGDGNADR